MVACSAAPTNPPPPPSPIASAPAPVASVASAPVATEPPPTVAPSPAPEPTPPTHPGRAEAAERVLFLATHLRTNDLREACPVALPEVPRIRCLISLRYADEPDAKKLALTLYEETGSLAGLLPEESTLDGKGKKVQLKPARPIGRNKQHLVWIIDAMREYGTPSAFAVSQNIGYNLNGTVNVNDEAVRDTLFHEIFHLNDVWQENFSARLLAPIETRIISRCQNRQKCLEQYAPTDTTMNGKSYAFTDVGNGKEYAAELALRYFREQRLMIDGKPLPVQAFKCGPPENAEAMTLLVDTFFGGVDLVPACQP
jgi:hypothetical protein